MNVERRLSEVVSSVFGVDPGELTADASPKTIEAWDSVGHLQLMLAIEAEFGLQFTPDEMAAFTTLGAIRSRLEEAIGA